MKLIKNKLIPEENCVIIYKGDIGRYTDEYIYPESFDLIYLGKQLDSLEKVNEVYEEITLTQFKKFKKKYEEELKSKTLVEYRIPDGMSEEEFEELLEEQGEW